jgi:hypothetical protein
MTVTTNERGQQNMFAKEPLTYIDPKIQEKMNQGIYETHNERAEKLNGRVAMVSLTLAMISYVTTGTLCFNLF